MTLLIERQDQSSRCRALCRCYASHNGDNVLVLAVLRCGAERLFSSSKTVIVVSSPLSMGQRVGLGGFPAGLPRSLCLYDDFFLQSALGTAVSLYHTTE